MLNKAILQRWFEESIPGSDARLWAFKSAKWWVAGQIEEQKSVTAGAWRECEQIEEQKSVTTGAWRECEQIEEQKSVTTGA